MPLLLRPLPRGELHLRLLARKAIRLANVSRELLAAAGDRVELLHAELAPVPQGVCPEMRPVAGDAGPLHALSFAAGRGEAHDTRRAAAKSYYRLCQTKDEIRFPTSSTAQPPRSRARSMAR